MTLSQLRQTILLALALVGLPTACDQQEGRDTSERPSGESAAQEQQEASGQSQASPGNGSPAQATQAGGVKPVESCKDQQCGTPCDPCAGAEGPCEASVNGFCNADGECVLIDEELLECPNWNACELGDVEVASDGCSSCTCELVDGEPQMVCSQLDCEVPCDEHEDCKEGQYCARPLETCGDGPIASVCTDLPVECSESGGEVCGCDGKWWSSPCTAAQQGVSVSGFGGCELGDGKFACGEESCSSNRICQVSSESGGKSSTKAAYTAACERAPEKCDGRPSCACINLRDNERCEEIGGHVFVIDLFVF